MPSIYIAICIYMKLGFKEGAVQMDEDFVTQPSSSVVSLVLVSGNLSSK